MTRYWRMKSKLHHFLRGHDPVYGTFRGGLTGTVYVHCLTCERERSQRQEEYTKELRERIRG